MPPTFIRVVKPDEEAEFRSLIPQTSEVKQGKSQVLRGCTTCTKNTNDGVKLRACTRCKAVYYCSTDCQRANWPMHKQVCAGQDKRIRKLFSYLMVNPLLMLHLQTSIILALNLLEDRRPEIPIFAIVHINVEPAYIGHTLSLLVPNSNEDVEGMLQINDIDVSHVKLPNGLPPMEAELWQKNRQQTNAQGRTSLPLAIIKYIYQGDDATAVVSPAIIQEGSFELARDRTPIRLKSVLLGTEIILPKTYYSLLERLNTVIRQDRTNQLILHIPMNEVEKEVTRRAMHEEIEGEPIAVTLMRRKRGREMTFGGTQPV